MYNFAIFKLGPYEHPFMILYLRKGNENVLLKTLFTKLISNVEPDIKGNKLLSGRIEIPYAGQVRVLKSGFPHFFGGSFSLEADTKGITESDMASKFVEAQFIRFDLFHEENSNSAIYPDSFYITCSNSFLWDVNPLDFIPPNGEYGETDEIGWLDEFDNEFNYNGWNRSIGLFSFKYLSVEAENREKNTSN